MVGVDSNSTLNQGLIAYYPFNGNANDESGNGLDGTVNGASLTLDRHGNANSAFDFDGEDDWIDATAHLMPISGAAPRWGTAVEW